MSGKQIEGIRRLSNNLSVAEITHEKDRPRILGEQLNEALKKGEAREAHRLSRFLAGRRMGARRIFTRILATRQCSEERARTLEQPIDKGGCHGLRIIFHNEVESIKERSDLIFVDQNVMLQGHAFNLRCGSLGTGEPEDSCFSERRSTKTAKARDWIQR